MKTFLILLAIVGAGNFLYQQRIHALDEASNPEIISNPVYVELQASLDINGRSVSQVFLVKTVNQLDCMDIKSELEKAYGSNSKIESSVCKPEIEPRYERLFDNQPTYVTYLSIGREDRHEREIRIITWGITVEESDKLCVEFAESQKGNINKYSLKGPFTCIHAIQS